MSANLSTVPYVTIFRRGDVSAGVNAASTSLDAPPLVAGRPGFAEVAAQELDAVYRYLVYLTGDRAAAEDLAAETFEKAFRSWRRFDPRRAAPRTWLCKIARGVAVDWFRAERRRRRCNNNSTGITRFRIPAAAASSFHSRFAFAAISMSRS